MSEDRKPIPFVTYDADGRIDMDLPCLKCGYNLRGLDDDVGCPECGESVYESVRLARLCQHDPTWLRRMARATVWIGIAVVFFVLYLWHVVLMPGRHGAPPSLDDRYLALALGTVVGGLGFLGVITAPQRGDHISLKRVRRVARWTMAAGLASIVLAMNVDAFFRAHALSYLLSRGSLLCLVVGAWATRSYAVALAAKIPDPRLAKQVQIVGWGFTLCFCLYLAAPIIRGHVRPLIDWQPVAVMIHPVTLILSIWTIALPIWYRRRFREALKMAQKFTDGHTAHPSGALKRMSLISARLVVHALIGAVYSFLLANLMFSLLPLSAYVGALATMLIAAVTIRRRRARVRLILLLYYVVWMLVFAVGLWAAMTQNRDGFEFLFDWAGNLLPKPIGAVVG